MWLHATCHEFQPQLIADASTRRPITTTITIMNIVNNEDHSAPEAPETPPRKRSTRDIRRDVHLLRDIGWKQQDIATKLAISIDTVRYAIKTRATPQHNKAGRPSKLSDAQVDEIITWISSSTRNRRLPFYKVTAELFPNSEISVDTLRYALKKRGYKRYVALRKPPLSAKNKEDRLRWAIEHLDWTINQWKLIIWSDETWVTAGRHKKTYVTRKQGEELDITCVLQRQRRPPGWMFWDCFHGNTKGISLFWEKDWGSISKETYCTHVTSYRWLFTVARLARERGLY